MTAIPPEVQPSPIVYPSSDSEPVEETYAHLYTVDGQLIGFYREDTGENC